MDTPVEAARQRKQDHLRIALADPSVQRPGRSNGLAELEFEMLSLPELDLGAIDTRVSLLGKALRAPLLVGAMTGGTSEAGAVNRILAEAAERCGVGFCLGSQRAMLDGDGEAGPTFSLRDVAPTTLICGNIGAIQLRDYGPECLDALAAAVGADAVFVHLNPLQEAVQPEGDRDWRGVYDALAIAVSPSSTSLVVKEVGAGLSRATLEALSLTGIAGVETAGVGGTSWSQIEALRHVRRSPRAIAGEILAGFGTQTARSVRLARAAFPRRIVIGSGGLRDGHEAAKCIALGADAVAMAWPFLVAARESDDPALAVDAVVDAIDAVIETLRITMFLVGAPTLSHLAATPLQQRHDG